MPILRISTEHRAQGTERRAQGMGHGAWGMEHGAWGVEHGVNLENFVSLKADKGTGGNVDKEKKEKKRKDQYTFGYW